MTLATLAARNLLRNKVRLLLTVLGVAVAVMTFITLHTTRSSWEKAAGVARRDRVVTRHKVTFIMPLPRRYLDDLRSARAADGRPLVRAATSTSWFGGKDPRHDREFFATLAVEGSFADVYDEVLLSEEQRAAFAADRSGALVGEVLAAKMGWKIGDRVTLESSIYPAPEDRPWTFTIEGIYGSKAQSLDRSSFLFHYERLDEALPPERQNEIGTIVSRTAEDVSAAEVGLAIDRMFEDRDVQTLSEDERTFNTGFIGMISAVLDVIGVLSLVILGIMALVLGNTIGMSARERTSEHATLLAVGFRPSHVARLVLAESALTAGLGAIVGAVLGLGLVDRGLGRFFEANFSGFFPVFRVDASTLGLSVIVTVALGAAAAVIPALSAGSLRVADALRKIA